MSVRTMLGVSWSMPPGLYPRSIQVARLMKGLQPLGWQSTILTPRAQDRSPAEPIDPDLAATYAGAYDELGVDVSRVDAATGPLLARWRQWAGGEAELSDDELWTARAIAAAERHIRHRRVDVLVTFAQPWSDHQIGLALAEWHRGLPWVAHFSDPWTDSLYYANYPEDIRQRWRGIEDRVVARADAVVFTNRYARDLVMAKYPQAWHHKAHVVPHVTDPDLLAMLSPIHPPPAHGRPLKLAHVGNLLVGRRRGHALFEALALLHRRRSLAGRLEMVLLGGGSGLYEAREKVFELSLEPVVTFHPRVSHRESLKAMAATDVLVIIDAPAATNVFMPSKVVDYLMARRPILALTPSSGSTADIMRALDYPIVDSDDSARLAGVIEGLLDQHERGGLTVSTRVDACLADYALAGVSRTFAGILDAARAARSRA